MEKKWSLARDTQVGERVKSLGSLLPMNGDVIPE